MSASSQELKVKEDPVMDSEHKTAIKLFDKSLDEQAKQIAIKHILTAGPLDALKDDIKKNPNVLLSVIRVPMKVGSEELTLEGTLEELAFILWDTSLKTGRGFVDKGCAETLKELRQSLLPKSLSRDIKEIVIPHDDKIAKQRLLSVKTLEEIIKLFKEKKLEDAFQLSDNYLKSIKPVVVKDNEYFASLMHYHFLAWMLLYQKYDDVINGDYSKQVDYMNRIIKPVQSMLPPRCKQIIINGVRRFIMGEQSVPRDFPQMDPDRMYDGGEGSIEPRDIGVLGVSTAVDLFRLLMFAYLDRARYILHEAQHLKSSHDDMPSPKKGSGLSA